MAVKDAHNGVAFLEWEDDIRMREPEAIKKWTKQCARRIEYYKMLQYLFFKQWKELRAYAASKDIKIIGLAAAVSNDVREDCASSGFCSPASLRLPGSGSGL